MAHGINFEPSINQRKEGQSSSSIIVGSIAQEEVKKAIEMIDVLLTETV